MTVPTLSIIDGGFSVQDFVSATRRFRGELVASAVRTASFIVRAWRGRRGGRYTGLYTPQENMPALRFGMPRNRSRFAA